jgi:predicted 2-oxoglutarate/Fe(II)-dependent dioxygenase YbiX
MEQSLDGGQYFGLSPEWRFLQYDRGGYFKPHLDGRETRDVEGLGSDSLVMSRLTVQLYLNSCGVEYKGGEFSFFQESGDFIIQPKAGDCIVFYQEDPDVSDDCLHEGKEIKSGNSLLYF